ncbi:IS4 family transposase [Legionella beliardensis]|nr:IS4 family transposase [Legionella beliardensis]
MHVSKIVHQLLKATIHKTRITTLSILVEGVIDCKALKLTLLGRHIKIKGKECSGINRVDRFLGNPFYQTQSIAIYRAISHHAMSGLLTPLLIVDWSSIPGSHLTRAGEHCLLRASLAAQGRSITVYEEVHPKSKEGNTKVHQTFLSRLKSLVSVDSKPCIVTDAGFKNPWFKAVLALGWNYIGRLNGAVHYDDGTGFKPLSALFEHATSKPQAAGSVIVAKTNPLTTKIYLYKKPAKRRKHRGKTGKILTNKQSRKQAKSHSEPWILTSSLTGNHIEELIINYYKLRMTIEESFRDTKSQYYGLSLNENVTLNVKRYIVWLLLAALATFIAWIVGYTAEKLKLHYDFQANSYRHRRVLSFFFLGCQVIRKRIKFQINIEDIQRNNWGILMDRKR